ncbi:MAG: ATP-binding cassette domain-containing protein [Rhodospirillales bacterium]|nr:ATP-binding cassette domain-containing protein [Rhodospirillales bacterium]
MSGNTKRSWLRAFLKPIKPVFREVLAMSFFVNILALAVPVFTLQVYDRVVFHAGISTLQGLVLGMLLVLAFDYVLRQSRSRIMQRVALRVDVVVGQRVFEKFTSLPLKTLEAQPGAHWQSLFRDVDIVRNTLSGASAILMADLPFAILFLGVIFVVAPAIAWVLLVLLPLFVFIAWRSAAVMSGANAEERETSQSRDSLIAEMIAGRTTIKALALDRAMRPEWEEKHAENIERAITRGGKADTFSNLGATLTTLTTICMTSIGAIAIIDQRLTMGGLIATNMLSGRLIGPLNQLVGQWRTYSSFRQAVERLGTFFAETSERQESDVKLDKPRGEIAAEMACFSYSEEGANVVDNVSIKIEQGGVSALVGRNGSGKTTLLKLLMGLYLPSTGRILLDGADISQFSRPELAAWMGYVPQQSVLFAGTIRDNIAHRVPEASDDEIVNAAKASGIHDFIIDQPDGYASDIGEAGQRLSGGQRQRIAIARALVGDPPVLLLDEPSSSLDRQAEIDLRKTLEELSKRHTVIVVTHSPILLAVCRDLIALDRGKVALAGPASEILPRLFGGGARPAPRADEEPAKKADEKPPAKKAEPSKPQKAATADKSAEEEKPASPPQEKPVAAKKPAAAKSTSPAKKKPVEPSPLLQAIEPGEAPADEKKPLAKPAPKKPAAAKKPVEPSPLLQALQAQEAPAAKKKPRAKPAAKKPKTTKAPPPAEEKSVEPSPLLKAIEAQKSQAKESARGSELSKKRRTAKKRKAPEDTVERKDADVPAPDPGTKPILRVFSATRPPPSAGNDESLGLDLGTAPPIPPVPQRPVLTVTQGGKKKTGTNDLAPPSDNDDVDDGQ